MRDVSPTPIPLFNIGPMTLGRSNFFRAGSDLYHLDKSLALACTNVSSLGRKANAPPIEVEPTCNRLVLFLVLTHASVEAIMYSVCTAVLFFKKSFKG